MHQVNGGDVVFTQVVFSYSGKMLIAGTSNGTIRAVKYPLTDPGEWQEHLAHSSSVTRVGGISHKYQWENSFTLYTCTLYLCVLSRTGNGGVYMCTCTVAPKLKLNCYYMYMNSVLYHASS